MKIKTIDTYGIEREYNSLEEARDDLDSEYIACFDDDHLSDSLFRLFNRIQGFIDGYEDPEDYEEDGIIVVDDR